MAYKQELFAPDYPGAIVVPAFPGNVIDRFNFPKGIVLHSPEEPVDDIEVTPYYFARDLSPRRAYTHFYFDSDGDVYQMVPVSIGAVANGVQGKPYPPWAIRTLSLNLQTENCEIEGYAAGMHRTCLRGSRQWNSVVKWIENRCRFHRIPITRERILGHYEVSDRRTDPGTLDIDGIVEDAVALREASDMPSADELTKLFGDWEGTMHEAAAYMSRRVKMPTGLIKRLEAIVNLAKSG